MKGVQKLPVDRCTGQGCPSPQKAREEEIKEAFSISSSSRKDANRTILQLAERYHGRIARILSAVQRQVARGDDDMPRSVLVVLVERLEGQRKRDESALLPDEIRDLEEAKRFLRESK